MMGASVPDWEDFAQMIRTDDFAEAVTVTRADGQVLSLAAIYDSPYQEARLGEASLDTGDHSIVAAGADLPGVKRGDTALIRGAVFDVMGPPQDDGTGLVRLPLAERVGQGA